jgi:hypothetical protein
MDPHHLLTVWNPSYAEDALDAHLHVLLRWAERSRDPADAASPEEDVYVWWAKIRSPRRDGELPHAAEIAALQSQIDDDVETHLYLTDYRSLYVGPLGEVTADAACGTPATTTAPCRSTAGWWRSRKHRDANPQYVEGSPHVGSKPWVLLGL